MSQNSSSTDARSLRQLRRRAESEPSHAALHDAVAEEVPLTGLVLPGVSAIPKLFEHPTNVQRQGVSVIVEHPRSGPACECLESMQQVHQRSGELLNVWPANQRL